LEGILIKRHPWNTDITRICKMLEEITGGGP